MESGGLPTATIPAINRRAASTRVEIILATLKSRRWPRAIPVPDIYVASTIRRMSWVASRFDRAIFHDEGVLDLCAAATQLIHEHNRYTASPITYSFLTEQLVYRGRRDLASLLSVAVLKDARHPVFDSNDPRFVEFMLSGPFKKRTSLNPHIGTRHWVVSNLFSEGRPVEIARSLFLCHELGHYFCQFESECRKFIAPFGFSRELKSNEEALADILAIALTCSTSPRSLHSGLGTHMSGVLGICAALLLIHAAFCRIRLHIDAFVGDETVNAFRLNQLDVRTQLVADAVADRNLVESIFRWSRTKAKYEAAIIESCLAYAAIVSHSIQECSEIMLDALSTKLDTLPTSLRERYMQLNEDPWQQLDYSIMLSCRDALRADDIWRLHGKGSAQTEWHNREIKAEIADSWKMAVPLRPEVEVKGARRIRREHGVFMDMRAWKTRRLRRLK